MVWANSGSVNSGKRTATLRKTPSSEVRNPELRSFQLDLHEVLSDIERLLLGASPQKFLHFSAHSKTTRLVYTLVTTTTTQQQHAHAQQARSGTIQLCSGTAATRYTLRATRSVRGTRPRPPRSCARTERVIRAARGASTSLQHGRGLVPP
jgi:hypothetical protein